MAGMMRRGLDVLRGGAPGVFLMALVACTGEPPEPDAGVDGNGGALRVGDALGVEDVEGFRRADGPRAFEFPRDHGPHPGFRNEWWYLTGNLDDPDGGRHGFHITFFRVALAPELEGDPAFHGSSWATPRLWMAHAAILDVEGDWHGSEERFARDAAGLAGASEPAGRVWLEDWELAGLAGDTWDLRFTVDGRELELELDPERAPVLQGEAGLSQKGPEPGNASYYYSVPRIAARGTLRDANDDERLLSGQAWLDREWSSGALAAGQIGWNWFALQFDDGTDLMYYQLRREDGAPHERSKGRWMPADAPDHELRPEHVELEPLRHARMPSGNRYPVVWAMTVTLPDGNSPRRFRVEAVREFQEMDTVIPYWEGAVDIRDEEGELLGRGFVELTGYEREDEE